MWTNSAGGSEAGYRMMFHVSWKNNVSICNIGLSLNATVRTVSYLYRVHFQPLDFTSSVDVGIAEKIDVPDSLLWKTEIYICCPFISSGRHTVFPRRQKLCIMGNPWVNLMKLNATPSGLLKTIKVIVFLDFLWYYFRLAETCCFLSRQRAFYFWEDEKFSIKMLFKFAIYVPTPESAINLKWNSAFMTLLIPIFCHIFPLVPLLRRGIFQDTIWYGSVKLGRFYVDYGLS